MSCHLSFTPLFFTNSHVGSTTGTTTITDTIKENSGSLANTFDAQAVQHELDVQTRVTQTFDTNRQEVKAEINSIIDEANRVLENDPNNKEAQKTVSDMQNLGILVDSISGALYSPSDSLLGTVANALSPAIVYEIGQHFKEEGTEGSAAHILAQTLVAAATASIAGNDALTAGLSAGGAEILAPKLAEWLYGIDPNDHEAIQNMTSEQKQTISAIISVGSAAVGATAGETTDVISSSVAGTVAVEDNRLSKQQASIEFANRVKKCVESGRSAKDCGESIHMIGVGLNPDGLYSSYYIKDEKTGQIYADPVYSKDSAPTITMQNGYYYIDGKSELLSLDFTTLSLENRQALLYGLDNVNKFSTAASTLKLIDDPFAQVAGTFFVGITFASEGLLIYFGEKNTLTTVREQAIDTVIPGESFKSTAIKEILKEGVNQIAPIENKQGQ